MVWPDPPAPLGGRDTRGRGTGGRPRGGRDGRRSEGHGRACAAAASINVSSSTWSSVKTTVVRIEAFKVNQTLPRRPRPPFLVTISVPTVASGVQAGTVAR